MRVKTTRLPVEERRRGHSSGQPAKIRWGAVRLAFVALAAGLILGLLAPRLLAAGKDDSRSADSHIVAEGETLWQLAGQYGDGGDRREFVYETVRLNGLRSPGLLPGQRIVLP